MDQINTQPEGTVWSREKQRAAASYEHFNEPITNSKKVQEVDSAFKCLHIQTRHTHFKFQHVKEHGC